MDHKKEDWTPPIARVMGVGRNQQHNLQLDLNTIYNWALQTNMFFNCQSSITFHIVHFVF